MTNSLGVGLNEKLWVDLIVVLSFESTVQLKSLSNKLSAELSAELCTELSLKLIVEMSCELSPEMGDNLEFGGAVRWVLKW